MSPKRTHVIKRKNGWAVKKQGAAKALRVYKTKAEAIERASKLRKDGYDIIIHREDGSVQKWEYAMTA